MGWFKDFLDKLIRPRSSGDTVIIDIPADIYYKELAIYTATSLIGNAISRSEIKCYIAGKPTRTSDYYLLNVSPNANETSAAFWHKVINRTVRDGKAVVVDAAGKLYCADSWVLDKEQPILGDVYSGVTTGNFTFNRRFTQDDCYVFSLNDINVRQLIDGMYQEYGRILSTAAKSFRQTNGQKYKLHIDGVKSGDTEFEREFEEVITKELKNYMSSDNAVYPEFDGYDLQPDKQTSSPKSSDDYIKLRDDLFKTVAAAFHIPASMMTGNITNMQEIVSAFLSFGVDPYADMISEALNKRGGLENYIKGNYYAVDTGKINHRDIFAIAAGASNLISSGTLCIDEIREELGLAPLNTEWSRKHFITKNFEEIGRFLNGIEGGET